MVTLPFILLKKFNPDWMDFPIWLNYFEYLVYVLHIPDDRKTHILLNMMDYNTLLMIKEEIAPDKIQYLSYDMLVDTLENMYSSYPGKYTARFRFEIRNQMNGEPARHYADTLTKLIKKCNFIYHEDSILLDRFITGLRSQRAVNTLSQIRNLTLEIAINLTESIEFHENKNYSPKISANMDSKNFNKFLK
ncbi:hypothetical protein M0804_013852 [Polistes exclamans]|nr:hypothetical protein M0804_013852 [Polistes exclamans]